MQKSIIFHLPVPLVREGVSGSQIRPAYMAEAFKQIGYQVELVTGNVNERKKAIKQIKKDMMSGKIFDFVYSESSTMPTALTEKHHFPTAPFLDFNFFIWLKKRSIPVGLFYRDIHWRFELYRKSVSLPKRMISIPFYWYDWLNYFHVIDHLFLPSLAMQNVLPTQWPDNKVSALPPGCIIPDLNEVNSIPQRDDESLRLFYVGGIKPPLYNLRAMVDIVSKLENISLTICCRKLEWDKVKTSYGPINQNIHIVHAGTNELKEHYVNSDVFALFWEPHPYLDFAVPVKVIEALGYGIPIITTNGTEAARFVLKEGLGWVVSGYDEFRQLLLELQKNRNIVDEKKRQISKVRFNHTWKERAKTVANCLTSRGI